MFERLPHHEIKKGLVGGIAAALGMVGVTACGSDVECGGTVEAHTMKKLPLYGDQHIWADNSGGRIMLRDDNPFTGERLGVLSPASPTVTAHDIQLSVAEADAFDGDVSIVCL